MTKEVRGDSPPTKRRQFIARFAMAGFGFAVLVFVLGYLSNLAGRSLGGGPYEPIELISLILCPPSLGLMAAENATGFGRVLVLFEIAILNSLWYAVLGAIVFRLWVRSIS